VSILALEAYSGERRFSEVVSAIYHASGSPTLWRPVLEHMTREFGAFGAQLNVFDPADGSVKLSISHGCEWLTPARLRRFSELSPTDPRLPYALAHTGMPMHCRQAVDDQVLHASQLYPEILGPGDCEYAMAAHVVLHQKIVFFGVLRRRAQGVYTHEDVGRFSLFMPHIRRAIGLGLSLSQLDYSRQVAFEAFEALPYGLALVSKDLRVLYSNAIATKILAQISERANVLSLEAPMHARIEALVTKAADAADMGGSSSPTAAFDIVCSAGRSIRVRVTGIDNAHAQPLLGSLDRNCALVHFEENDSIIETDGERLERMYGLTAAEIRVANGVAEGGNPKILARTMDVSPETIRSQLKAVFRKTRTASQAELVKLLDNLPVWPSSPPPRL